MSFSRLSLGSPKYKPPVNSRTIKISLPLIFFSFKGDACNNESNPLIGRRFENKFSSFLIFNKPFSGRTLTGILSHLGPPTAPCKIASADLQRSEERRVGNQRL